MTEVRCRATAAGEAQRWQLATAWLRWGLRVRKWKGGWDVEAGRLLEGALAGTARRSAREWVRYEAELMLSSTSVAEERTVAAVGRATRALAELGGGKR
eukprot:1974918-Prymnesium_polylepis.1